MRGIRRGERGYTLAEALIVVALWGLIAITITFSLNRWLLMNNEEVKRMEEERRVIESLDRFSRDAHEAMAVLAVAPERTIFWSADADSDGVANPSEVIEYRWEEGGDWIRGSPQGEIRLARLMRIEIGADTAPPATRHLVVRIAYRAGKDEKWIGTSAALRVTPPPPEIPR